MRKNDTQMKKSELLPFHIIKPRLFTAMPCEVTKSHIITVF